MYPRKIQAIDRQLLELTTQEARATDRKRINHNFHLPEDTIQRFLNAIEPESYIRPHRHIDPLREEIFLVLRGKGAVIIFDDDGMVNQIHLLDSSLGFYGIDIPGGIYHTIVSTEFGSVFYEIKQGPYNPKADKGYAPWAPSESDTEAVTFLDRMHRIVSEYKPGLD